MAAIEQKSQPGQLPRVALVPATGGIFTVEITHSSPPSTVDGGSKDQNNPSDELPVPQTTQLWDRKSDGGFPETKKLKQLVRNVIDPSRDLGHVDRHASNNTATIISTSQAQVQNQRPPPAVSPSLDQRTEKMVTDLMSLLPVSLRKNGGRDDQTPKQTPAEVSARQTAEKMVADILSSFGGHQSKTDDSAGIGDGNILLIEKLKSEMLWHLRSLPSVYAVIDPSIATGMADVSPESSSSVKIRKEL
ncbi:MAG: hypothetical protein Q9216_000615 [Gyalolechia sp. 2 TL-2023]